MKKSLSLILCALSSVLFISCAKANTLEEELLPQYKPAYFVEIEDARKALDAYDKNVLFLQDPQTLSVLPKDMQISPECAELISKACFHYFLAGKLASSEIDGIDYAQAKSDAFFEVHLQNEDNVYFLISRSWSNSPTLKALYYKGIGNDGVVLYEVSGDGCYWNIDYPFPLHPPII